MVGGGIGGSTPLTGWISHPVQENKADPLVGYISAKRRPVPGYPFPRRLVMHTWKPDAAAGKGPAVGAALKAGVTSMKSDAAADLFLSIDKWKLEGILAGLPEKGSRSAVADAMDTEMALLEEVLFAFEECQALARCGFLIRAFSVNCWWCDAGWRKSSHLLAHDRMTAQ